jgi:hypothetical protein
MIKGNYKARKYLKKADWLQLTPFKLYDAEERGEGLVTVLIPRTKSKAVKKYFGKYLKSEFIKIDLDKFGSAVWKEIDGQKKVIDIAELLKKQFGEEIEPAHQRLVTFIFQMYQTKLILFNEITDKGENNG